MQGSGAGGPADRRTDVTLSPSTPLRAGSGGGPDRTVFSELFATLRKVAGMPDYEAYLEHLRHSHPDWPVPTEREFYADFVRSRYEDGPTRCC